MTDRVTDVGRVPADGSFLLTVRDVATGERREAILVRADAGDDAPAGSGPSESRTPGDDGDAASGGDGDDVGGGGDSDGSDPPVRGWLNYCRHLTHVPLDKGNGAPIRDGEIVCINHGAMFEADTGRCTFGPCEGAVLEPVEVAVEGDGVYLTDDDYAFVGTGPAESGDDDLTSTSNVEF